MIELPVDLPAELVPLSWLIGVWEGSGVIDYKVGDESITHEFGQRVSFSHDGMPHLNYTSYTWLFPDEAGGDPTPLATETGYWRLEREPGRRPGPGAAARGRRAAVSRRRGGRDAAQRRRRVRPRSVARAPRRRRRALPRPGQGPPHRPRHRRRDAHGRCEGLRRGDATLRTRRGAPALGVGHRRPRPRPAEPTRRPDSRRSTDDRHPRSSPSGAGPAEGVDAGVAGHYGNPSSSSASSSAATPSSISPTAACSRSRAPTGSAGCTRWPARRSIGSRPGEAAEALLARRIRPHRARSAHRRRRRDDAGSSSKAPRRHRWPRSSTGCGSCCASRSPIARPSSP